MVEVKKMVRVLGYGSLDRGFTINNSVYKITIPKKTKVVFGFNSEIKSQIIQFDRFPSVYLFRPIEEGEPTKWYASAFGQVLALHYDTERPPYPLSYFK